MKNEVLQNLLDALAISPGNIPLRLQVATLLLDNELYTEAGRQFQQILENSYGNLEAKIGLAACYTESKKYSAALIIYEQISDELPLTDQVRYAKCLVAEGSTEQAIELYERMMADHPGFYDEALDAQLRIPVVPTYDYAEDEGGLPEDEAYFLQKPDLRFADVSGMEEAKREISLKIIEPLRHPELYAAFGKKAGGSILLYGPPGCGKTFIAKATAGEADAKFICISLHQILDMWQGKTEKNLHDIFEIARRNAPCILFIDEMDALAANRSDVKGHALRQVVNQFLIELDGVAASNEGVLVLAATNAPWCIDAAFCRPGRFDRTIFVAPPEKAARVHLLKAALKEKPVGKIDVQKIATATDNYSGADLKVVVDMVVEEKLEESIAAGAVQPIETADLLKAVQRHQATTLQWLALARSYATQAGERGLYTDMMRYLAGKK